MTVLLSSSEVLVIEDRPRPQIFKLLEIFEDSAFYRHSMIITSTMHLSRDEEDKELWLRVR